MRHPIRNGLFILLALGVLYLAAWPIKVDPESWQSPAAPAAIGKLLPNNALANVTWLARGNGIGPESVTIDREGFIVTGYLDGRLVRIRRDGGKVEPIANTGGRPLGVAVDRGGNLYVADANKGLLRVSNKQIEVLATGHDGIPFRFTDDVDVADDGTVYFSDASSKFGYQDYVFDVLEHRGNGRLLAWHPETRKTELLFGDIRFANGVAVAADQRAVLVNEMGNYRVLRYWLSGPKKGTHDVFADNLPGFPDNITLEPGRQHYWVALAAPRDPVVDALSAWPSLRRVIARLPEALRPKPKRHAQIVALDLEGKVLDYLAGQGPEVFAPVTSVREWQGYLYLGSFQREGIGKIGAP